LQRIIAVDEQCGLVQAWLHPRGIEAIAAFPILRPMIYDYVMLTTVKTVSLPADYREVIAVEYPINQTPPTYLVRKNRFDQAFYNSDGFYDVDHYYASTAAQAALLYSSGDFVTGNHVKTYYLANHDLAMLDNSTVLITIPDYYVHILIKYVVARAYREKLSVLVANPTSYSNVITQLVGYIEATDKMYQDAVNAAMTELTASRLTPHQHADKFDRVY
jgi:hypothetical protein